MYASLALGTADTLYEHGPSASANVRRRSLAVMDTNTSIIVAVKCCKPCRSIHQLMSFT
jgi:hypothetical protein